MRVVVSLVVLILLALPMLAAAQTDEPPEGAMLIILDASGSMNSLDQDGIPFIDKAKDAILELIAALPDGMQVGLRVYGHREPNTDPVRGCLDTELLAPVAPLDRAAVVAAIEGLEASGYTPIGLSLQEAAVDLPETGPRSIVLISDGEDTCAPPDPCRIAEELFGDLFDVRIESVGFLVGTGSAAEQQLVGCPLPASLVARTDSIRSRVAMLWTCALSRKTTSVASNLPDRSTNTCS